MSGDRNPIEASTKVAVLLDEYPELEEVLIGLAPPFKKLKNPILRRSVAKVASLQQAAAVARMPVNDILNALRAAVGQPPVTSPDEPGDEAYLEAQPEWFDPAKVVASIDEAEAADDAPMPLVTLLQTANQLQSSEIVELKTDFLPAPGIDAMKNKGFLAWTHEVEPGVFRSYFKKPA